MAHFAKLNESNIVEQVIVIDNKHCCGGTFPDSEICGQRFIQKLGLEGIWKQTSYNNSFRTRFAGINFTYNELLDSFIPPKPFDSWVFDSDLCDWIAPVPYPNDSNSYYWNENSQEWIIQEYNNGI